MGDLRLGPRARWSLGVLAVAVGYVCIAQIGIQWAIVRAEITPIWPAAGFALAVPLLAGIRFWPGIALGALLTTIMVGASPVVVLVIATANTLGPLLAYFLLRQLGFRHQLERMSDAVLLVAVGAMFSMAALAVAGTGTLTLDGVLGAQDFWPTVLVWWTGDAIGVLTVTPLLLVASRFRLPRTLPLTRWAEAAALGACGVGVAILASTTPPKLFLVFPVLIWAALRFRQAGALAISLGVCAWMMVTTAHGLGPYGTYDLSTRMLLVQAYDATVALTALVLSTVTLQRDRATAELSQALRQISDMVNMIAPRQSLRSAMTARQRKPVDDEIAG